MPWRPGSRRRTYEAEISKTVSQTGFSQKETSMAAPSWKEMRYETVVFIVMGLLILGVAGFFIFRGLF